MEIYILPLISIETLMEESIDSLYEGLLFPDDFCPFAKMDVDSSVEEE